MTKPERLPAELQTLIAAVDACEREAETLVAGLSEAEVNWQVAPGASWSVAQCLDHLAVINPFYLAGFLARVEKARQQGIGPFAGLSSSLAGRQFVNSLEPPVRRKVRAPAAVVPRSTIPLAGLVDAFKTSHDPYRALVQAAADVDVNRVKGPNPFLKIVPMRLSTVLQIIPAHDRRHLWQARRVREELRTKN